MKILVVGDGCKDVFVYGKVDRLTPEAPVPVFNPTRELSNDGMAKNVANNVEALGCTIYTITNPNSIKKVRYVDEKSKQLVLSPQKMLPIFQKKEGLKLLINFLILKMLKKIKD